MLATVLAAASALLLAAGLRPRHRLPLPVEVARTSTLSPGELAARGVATAPWWERLLRPLVAHLAGRLEPKWAGLSSDDIRLAGLDPHRISVEDVLAVKVLSGLAGAAIVGASAAILPQALLFLPAAAFGGFVAPSVVLRRRRLARRRRILRELPDLIGLLKAFVSAGITLEHALHLISAQQAAGPVPNLLAEEIRRALSDFGLGMSLEDALVAMGRRSGIAELEMVTAALAQGKRQGAAMERILRDQETVVRLQQRNRATAEASRVGTRLVGILVLVYLPEFMVLIMVPLFYGIFLRAFG